MSLSVLSYGQNKHNKVVAMLIGIDASRAVSRQKTGTERYSVEIIKALAKIDKNNQYILYAPSAPDKELSNLPVNFSWRIIPFPRLWSQIRLSWELIFGKTKPNVIFEPAHTIPLVHPTKIVVTIHDLGFKHFSQIYTPFERFYHNFSANFSAHHAKKIIAVSHYTKRDIINNYQLPPSKIKVIHHGIADDYFRTRRKVKKLPYFLYIGRVEMKKNIVNLVSAFAIFKQKTICPARLILAGKAGWGIEKIKKTISEQPSRIRKDIVMTGYISQKKYLRLLEQALAFVFVSNFEGFGMPILEAFASGVPVIASSTTSLPEVVGKAGELVNPASVQKIAESMDKLYKDKKLRENYIKLGLARVKEFSWERAGRETLKVLREVAEGR